MISILIHCWATGASPIGPVEALIIIAVAVAAAVVVMKDLACIVTDPAIIVQHVYIFIFFFPAQVDRSPHQIFVDLVFMHRFTGQGQREKFLFTEIATANDEG